LKGYIWITAAAVVLVAMVGWAIVDPLGRDTGCPPDCPTPTPATDTGTPETSVSSSESPFISISMASSSTKKEWLDESVESFNTLSKSAEEFQINGKPIEVEVVLEEGDHYRSGTMVTDILQGKIEPTIASPAEKSWISKLNRDWRALYRKPITTVDPPGLVRTPFVIAMWESRAKALGCWPTAAPECTWERIRALATSPEGWGMFGHPEWGKFKFGYGYVGASNSGTLTAIMECLIGAGKTSDLTIDDVDADNGCGKAIAEIERAKVHSSQRSSWLLGFMCNRGPEYLDAVTSYEKKVIEFNRDKRSECPGAREPMVAAYMQDGTIVVTHPFAILDGAPWVSTEQAAAAEIFRDYLLSPEQQQALVPSGLRPADSTLPLGSPIEPRYGANPDAELVVLEVPNVLVVDRIIEVWHEVKKHANIVLVFDKSGSMSGGKITDAVEGATEFVRAMDRADWLAWMPFDERIYSGTQGLKGDVGEQLEDDIRSTTAHGGTALYDAVAEAYRILEDQRKGRRDTVRYGLVILSDGKDESSKQATLALLEAMMSPTEDDPTGIQIHTIGIGDDADDRVLSKIAGNAHGKYWKVGESDDIAAIYREIAWYY